MKSFKNTILLICAISLTFLAGCSTARPNMSYKQTEIKLDTDDFEIVKTVTAEATSVTILGIIIRFQNNGYFELFEKAHMAGADDVINIKKVGTQAMNFLAFVYRQKTTKFTGTAIRWRKK